MNTIKQFQKGLKLILAMVALLLAGSVSMAQQDAMYGQYMFNTMSVNPGYAGSRDVLSAMLLTRNQWVGFDGAPKTTNLGIQAPFYTKNIGLGLSILNDRIGPIDENSLFIDIAYRFNITSTSYLSLGLKSGFSLHSIGLTDLIKTDESDNTLNTDFTREFLPNFGFGAFYFTPNFYVGVSFPKLLKNEINVDENSLARAATTERHMFFIAGYVMDVAPGVKFKPTTLVKAVTGAPLSVDLTGSLLFYDKLWLGMMFRVGDAVGSIVQYRISDQINVGYAYEYDITELSRVNSGTHEIMISYDFIFRKARVVSPRYF